MGNIGDHVKTITQPRDASQPLNYNIVTKTPTFSTEGRASNPGVAGIWGQGRDRSVEALAIPPEGLAGFVQLPESGHPEARASLIYPTKNGPVSRPF